MKSSLSVLKELFQFIDVADVRENITGRIYIDSVPDTSQLEDITIKTLVNANAYLQQGFINLNIHVPQVLAGRPNLDRFEELVDIIMPLVDDVQSCYYYFQLDDDKGIFKDQDRDNMYFYNLRLTFQTI